MTAACTCTSVLWVTLLKDPGKAPSLCPAVYSLQRSISDTRWLSTSTSMTDTSVARSCDTFVVLPPLTDSNFRIFGKNSDRPNNEVQEVIFVTKEHTTENKDHVHVSFNLQDDLSNLDELRFSAPTFKFHKSRPRTDASSRNRLGVGERRWVPTSMESAWAMKLFTPKCLINNEKMHWPVSI